MQGINDPPNQKIAITWLATGKPALKEKAFKQFDISLSHSESTLLCVAGIGPQGCDVETVAERTLDDWAALLGKPGEPLFKELSDRGENRDRAGARVWSALETLTKTTTERISNLSIEKQSEDRVVFRAGEPDPGVSILTFPIRLTRGSERMIAVACRRAQKGKQTVAEFRKSIHAEKLNYNMDVYSMGIEDGPQKQPPFVFRFPVTFRETSNLSKTLYFANFFGWIGKLREFMVHPIYEKMVEMFSSEKWGMVTNHAETRIFGEAKSGDVIEGRIWLEKMYGQLKSSLDFRYEWRKLLPNGVSERIATSTMSTTWVAIRGHGSVEAHKFPVFGYEFLETLLPPPGSRHVEAPAEEPTRKIDLGGELYRVPPGPVQEPSRLREQTFETCLDDANLVGNIYFSHYYTWQGRVADRFLYETVPGYGRGGEQLGELRCIYSRVNHLNEAMPFDRIAVKMYPLVVYERGVRFYFDYYRAGADGQKVKLGYGEYEGAWYARASGGPWAPATLPKEIREKIILTNQKTSPFMPPRPGKENERYDVTFLHHR